MNEGNQHENSNNLGEWTLVDLSHDCEVVAWCFRIYLIAIVGGAVVKGPCWDNFVAV